jgi:hypothetical protein
LPGNNPTGRSTLAAVATGAVPAIAAGANPAVGVCVGQIGDAAGRFGSHVDGETVGSDQVGDDGTAGLVGVEMPGAGLVGASGPTGAGVADGAGTFFFLRTGRSGVSTAALRSSTGCFRAGGDGSGGGTHGGAFFGGTGSPGTRKGIEGGLGGVSNGLTGTGAELINESAPVFRTIQVGPAVSPAITVIIAA